MKLIDEQDKSRIYDEVVSVELTVKELVFIRSVFAGQSNELSTEAVKRKYGEGTAFRLQGEGTSHLIYHSAGDILRGLGVKEVD